MKYYLIESESDDYGACNMGVFYGKESSIKKYVYWYKEIPKEDYEILKKYINDINEFNVGDWGYEMLGQYLKTYF